MIRALARRLAYVRYLASPGFWRLMLDTVDYAVLDRIEPWTQLRVPTMCLIHPSASFRNAENISLGVNTRIQPFCVLWASPRSTIRIGENSGLGPHTMIYSSNHSFAAGRAYHDQAAVERDVVIGSDCWIGGGSIILPGVVIGNGCIVAAGSVVTRNVPDGAVVAGVPARVINQRTIPSLSGVQP